MPALQARTDRTVSCLSVGSTLEPFLAPATNGSFARDVQFLELLAAYRRSGGLATGSEIAARRPGVGLSQLARIIAKRELISLDWGGHRWLPVFQFEEGGGTVRGSVSALVEELSVALDDWELAQWFVDANSLLNGATPLELVHGDFVRVHDAARALRFVCKN
ncbi:hypothetical protein QTH87_20355 [Variovorax sp. J22P168]|uniref:hypothetical protein n=1 Tax=Variovorax jilinensis TaxID=3053513 RepID=UPI0025756821|nr:hypothetical protein [Variovorax sp. J22P168]MDM0014808.1 hypothetical protein [Variovorax sp. J22P168]